LAGSKGVQGSIRGESHSQANRKASQLHEDGLYYPEEGPGNSRSAWEALPCGFGSRRLSSLKSKRNELDAQAKAELKRIDDRKHSAMFHAERLYERR